MERRAFIKLIGGVVTAVTIIPISTIDTISKPAEGGVSLIYKDVKVVTMPVNDGDTINLIDFYNFLQNEWETNNELKKFPFPFEQKGYTLPQDDIITLRDGRI